MVKLFSGTAHPELSSEISRNLHIPLSHREVTRFENSEVRVRIVDMVKDETCIVIQPTANPTDMNAMELMFFADALKREGAQKVIGIIPYFGYARQNIQHRTGEGISANVIIRFLETVGFDEIVTLDLHDEATAGIFNIPFKSLTALSLLAHAVKKHLHNKVDDIAIVSPDQGGVERARKFGEAYFRSDTFEEVVIEKKRNPDIIHHSQAIDLHGDIRGKTAIIVDDIVTSGGTLIHAAKLCMDKGAEKVLAAVVHHDFGKGVADKLDHSLLEKFFTTNSIAMTEEYQFSKLEEVSIASLLSEEIKRFL